MSDDTPRVCYRDGWHWTVETDEAGNDVPDKKLVLEDDGSFRPATKADTESWHDRKHERFASTGPVGAE